MVKIRNGQSLIRSASAPDTIDAVAAQQAAQGRGAGLADARSALDRVLEATPQGLAQFAQQGKEQADLVEKLLAEGGSTAQIAGELHLSVKTVETHRAHLMDRLGIRDVPGLVRLAIRAGLVSPHD